MSFHFSVLDMQNFSCTQVRPCQGLNLESSVSKTDALSIGPQGPAL